MITHDDVFDRLADANPHPDTTDLVPTSAQVAAFLRELEEAPVETITRPPEPDNKPIRGGLLAAAGAFALILIVVGAAWLLNDDPAENIPADTTIAPTTVPPTTVATAEEPAVSASSQAVLDEFVATYNEGNVDRHIGLFAPGTTIAIGDNGGRPSPNGAMSGTGFNRTLDQHRDRIAHEVRMGTTIELTDCAGDEVVACSARYRDFISEALMGGDRTTLTMEIADGRIHLLREVARDGLSYDEWLWGMSNWVEAEYGVSLNNIQPAYDRGSAVKWHIFARLYLDYAGREFGPAPFAPNVPLEDLAVMWLHIDDFSNADTDGLLSNWPSASIEFEASELTLDQRGVENWSSWLAATGSSLVIESCEPRFAESVMCTVEVQEPFRTAARLATPIENDTLEWTMTIESDVVDEVLVFEPGPGYLDAIQAFRDWASDQGVEVLIDDSGFFLATEENIAAIEGLLEDYARNG